MVSMLSKPRWMTINYDCTDTDFLRFSDNLSCVSKNIYSIKSERETEEDESS